MPAGMDRRTCGVWLLKARTELRLQMVRLYNGHRHRVDSSVYLFKHLRTSELDPIPAQRCLLWSQRPALQYYIHDDCVEILSIPEIIYHACERPWPGNVPGYLSHGLRNYHQHDRQRYGSSVWGLLGSSFMGLLVDRCSSKYGYGTRGSMVTVSRLHLESSFY